MRGTPTIEAEAIPKALSLDKLFRRADLSGLASTTTRELPPAPVLADQRRAEEAIRLGTALVRRADSTSSRPGDPGPASRHRHTRRSRRCNRPAHRPRTGSTPTTSRFRIGRPPSGLPRGRAVPMQQAMRKMIEDLRVTLPALFESDDYQRRRTAIDETLRRRRRGRCFWSWRPCARLRSWSSPLSEQDFSTRALFGGPGFDGHHRR